MRRYPDPATETIDKALSANAVNREPTQVKSYSVPGIRVSWKKLTPPRNPPPPAHPPMKNLVRSICSLPRQRDVGNNVKSLHKKFSAIPLLTATLSLNPHDPKENLTATIFRWFFALIRTAAKYFLTHDNNPDFTDVSKFFIKSFKEMEDVTAMTFDAPAIAPGTTRADQGNLAIQTQITAIKALDGRHLAMTPVRTLEATTLHKLGKNPHSNFFLWLRAQNLKNIQGGPR